MPLAPETRKLLEDLVTRRTLPWLALLALMACTDPYEPPTGVDTDTNDPDDVDGDGFTTRGGDCDDNDANSFPGANDVVGDDIDQNCDGTDGLDEDGDGHAWTGSGGDDCDDADDSIYADAPEVGWDDIDQNCDGRDQFDFDQISMGKSHTCGLTTAGVVECWGADDRGQVGLRPLTGTYTHVDSGFSFSCAISTGGELTCWGSDDENQITDTPSGTTWDQLSVGHNFACALDTAGLATCWGENVPGYDQVLQTPSGTPMKDIAAGSNHACAITKTDGILACWGADYEDQVTDTPTFDDNYLQVALGADHSCAIRQDQGLRCWGRRELGQVSPPSDAGPYSQVSGADQTTCAIRENVEMSCWGKNEPWGLVADMPTGADFRYADAGWDHACAIGTHDGEVVCWGKNTAGQTNVPWP